MKRSHKNDKEVAWSQRKTLRHLFTFLNFWNNFSTIFHRCSNGLPKCDINMNRIYKWSFEADTIETILGSVLRTPGIILLDYWHQKCLDFSVPKSLELDDMADASLHLSVLLLVIIIFMTLKKNFVKLKWSPANLLLTSNNFTNLFHVNN